MSEVLGITFVDSVPPPKGRGFSKRSVELDAIADALKARPLNWALIATFTGKDTRKVQTLRATLNKRGLTVNQRSEMENGVRTVCVYAIWKGESDGDGE